jgi:hypothetical protein
MNLFSPLEIATLSSSALTKVVIKINPKKVNNLNIKISKIDEFNKNHNV